MTALVGHLWFGARQSWFLFNAVFYRWYLLLVFLSKPGAMWVVGILCHLAVFFLYHQSVGWPSFDPNAEPLDWAQTLIDWMQYDHEARGWWILLDVPLLIAGLLCQLFPPAVLRTSLAMFPAKGRPLPPIRRIKAPKRQIRTVRTMRRVGKKWF